MVNAAMDVALAFFLDGLLVPGAGLLVLPCL